jgi:hypothetical protein
MQDLVDACVRQVVLARQRGDAQAAGVPVANDIIAFGGRESARGRTGEADVEPLDEAANGVVSENLIRAQIRGMAAALPEPLIAHFRAPIVIADAEFQAISFDCCARVGV